MWFDPTLAEEYTLLELAYSLLVIVLNQMIGQQITTEQAMVKILKTLRLTFELTGKRYLRCIVDIQ